MLTALPASFKTSGVFAVIILLAIIGALITWGMSWIESHLNLKIHDPQYSVCVSIKE